MNLLAGLEIGRIRTLEQNGDIQTLRHFGNEFLPVDPGVVQVDHDCLVPGLGISAQLREQLKYEVFEQGAIAGVLQELGCKQFLGRDRHSQ